MSIIALILTAATVCLAGIGGLYYAFSCSVMPGLRSTDDQTFVAAMPQINRAIQNPVFALSFGGAFLALAGGTIYSWAAGLGSAIPVTAALALYSATLIITFSANIPLNNSLDRVAESDATEARAAFELQWTRWNHHRTWLSLASLVALSIAWTSIGK